VHKRLLALVVAVMLISTTMAVPVFAQEAEEEQQQAAMDVSTVFTAEFCPVLKQDAGVWALMLQMFPTLAETCPE